MTKESIRKEIVDGLAPMFKEAREKGLWFHGTYHDLWFTPDELEQRQSEGQSLWGAVNWKLRNPNERLQQLGKSAKSAAQQYNDFQTKLARIRSDSGE